MRGVDHDPVGFSDVPRQFDKDAVKHAHADEAVLDRLVRSVG